MRTVIGIVTLTSLLLQACATPDADTNTEATATGSAASSAAYVPQQGLSPKERFREVLALLEDGEPMPARAELVIYLEQQPDSDIGNDLLEQIDLPSSSYFPEEYQEVQLRSGVSLSNLSKQYLGDVYKFHALAKYNGIAKPRKLTAGQTIKIPLTAEALAAFNAESSAGEAMPEAEPVPVAEPIPEPAPEPMPEPEPAPEPEPEPAQDSARVEALHKEALNAYRAQDLDKAIGLWDEVLALDPGYESARLYRSQAVELKRKLSNLN